MNRRRTARRFIPIGVTVVGVVWMLVAALDEPWNGLDLLGLVIFLLGFMRLLRPVMGDSR